MNRIRILVVDDHPVVRQGLVGMLEESSDLTVVGQACNGCEAIEIFRQQQPDVTLMDLRMPEMDGIAAISAICAEFHQARIVVLSTYDSDEDIYRGLRSGAKGYLLKDTEPEELLAAIRTVHSGKQYIPPDVGWQRAKVITKSVKRYVSPSARSSFISTLPETCGVEKGRKIRC
jgi:two-component system NarL family response regulator